MWKIKKVGINAKMNKHAFRHKHKIAGKWLQNAATLSLDCKSKKAYC